MADLYISGLTGTFDTDGMVKKLIQIKQQPLAKLAQQRAAVQGRVASLSNLHGAITGLQNFFNSLDVNSLFSSKRANSSNTSVLTATATNNTPNMTMTINVNRLAQTEIRSSIGGMNSLTSTFSSSGTMTLRYWTDNANSQTFSINYSAGQTLQDLVNSINSAQDKVRASVYYTGSDYRLLLTEADAKESTRETTETGFVIEVDGMPQELGGLETIQNAQNAAIRIGNSNTEITSPSNTFSNVVSGLEITVKERGSATVTVSEDYSRVNNVLNDFVSNFNAIVTVVNQMTGKGAQFQGDSTITTVKTGMLRMIDPLIRAGLINYSDKDGTISINSTALNNLSSSNPERLREILSNIRSNFTGQLNAWSNSISTYRNIGESQITSINRRITELQNYLTRYEERLRREYSQLEAFINQTNQISSRIQDFVTTLSEMTKGGKK